MNGKVELTGHVMAVRLFEQLGGFGRSVIRHGANIGRRYARSTVLLALASCGTAPAPEPIEYPLGPIVASLEPESPRLATPQTGDEILFADTGDAHRLVGVVEGVADRGEVHFRYERGGRKLSGVLNLLRPDVRRERGRILNSYLRIRRRGDPPDARYLAGELLVGFRVGAAPPAP